MRPGQARAPLAKARVELLHHLLDAGDGGVALEADLLTWLAARPRFERFLSANRDKVRKKLRTASDADALLDVRAELLVASRLLADRRIDVAFEAFGSGKRGPDLTVAFRTNQRFNVEVTRLRAGALRVASRADDAARLAGVLLGKVRQLPVGMPNLVALVCSVGADTGERQVDIAGAVKLLKMHADRKEESVFTRRGFESARDFYAHYVRLSGAAVVYEAGGTNSGAQWANPEARHPLPPEAMVATSRCLTEG